MGKYDDIIYLDHPVSKNHKPMSIYDRSAQFAPFAALVGYDEAIKEAGRKTVEKVELGVDEMEILSRKLNHLFEIQKYHPLVTVTYFKKDEKKKGGAYLTLTSELKKMDLQERKLFLLPKTSINFNDILDIVIIENE